MYVDLFSLSSLTLDRMIHNYMRWRLVQKYVEDLSYNYVDNYRRYLNEYYGYALHSSNEEYCEREVLKKFPLAIYRLYTRDSNILPSTIQAVRRRQDFLHIYCLVIFFSV